MYDKVLKQMAFILQKLLENVWKIIRTSVFLKPVPPPFVQVCPYFENHPFYFAHVLSFVDKDFRK